MEYTIMLKKVVILIVMICMVPMTFGTMAADNSITIVEMGNCGRENEYVAGAEATDDVVYYIETKKSCDYYSLHIIGDRNGSGEMANYDTNPETCVQNEAVNGEAPWYKLSDKIRTVIVEDNVRVIGRDAFKYMSDVEYVLLLFNGLCELRDSAFAQCTSMIQVFGMDNVSVIGSNCFCGCSSLLTISLRPGVILGASCFEYCTSIEDVFIPKDVISLPPWSFQNCNSLVEVKGMESVVDIGEGCFGFCSRLKNVEISPSVTALPKDTFRFCRSLTYLSGMNNIVFIGDYCFSGCLSLRIFKFSPCITKIGIGCFANCDIMNLIFMPDDLPVKEKSALIMSIQTGEAFCIGEVRQVIDMNEVYPSSNFAVMSKERDGVSLIQSLPVGIYVPGKNDVMAVEAFYVDDMLVCMVPHNIDDVDVESFYE